MCVPVCAHTHPELRVQPEARGVGHEAQHLPQLKVDGRAAGHQTQRRQQHPPHHLLHAEGLHNWWREVCVYVCVCVRACALAYAWAWARVIVYMRTCKRAHMRHAALKGAGAKGDLQTFGALAITSPCHHTPPCVQLPLLQPHQHPLLQQTTHPWQRQGGCRWQAWRQGQWEGGRRRSSGGASHG